jgi:hypothetical protein
MMPSRRERFQKISAQARESTNKALADEISALSRLTEMDVDRLLPTKSDKERFGLLMGIVAAHADENRKALALRENIEEVGVVVVRLLRLLL